jgi:hypothetical protein
MRLSNKVHGPYLFILMPGLPRERPTYLCRKTFV